MKSRTNGEVADQNARVEESDHTQSDGSNTTDASGVSDSEMDELRGIAGMPAVEREKTDGTDQADGTEEETDETEEKTDETDGTEEETDETDENKEGIPPHIQKAIDKRIGKEVKKTKELEEKLAEAQRQIDALKASKEEPDARTNHQSNGLLESLEDMSLEQLDKREADILAFEAWAMKNFNGYEDKDVSYTGEEIREQYAKRQQERQHLIPKARELIRKRAEFDEATKKVYPALFDTASSDAVAMQELLKKVPGLRRLPNYRVLVGDMIAGEKLRRTKTPPGGVKLAPKMPRPGGSPATRSPVSPKNGNVPGKAIKSFLENGADGDALTKAMHDY